MLTFFLLRVLVCFCAGIIFARTLDKDKFTAIAAVVIFIATVILIVLTSKLLV